MRYAQVTTTAHVLWEGLFVYNGGTNGAYLCSVSKRPRDLFDGPAAVLHFLGGGRSHLHNVLELIVPDSRRAVRAWQQAQPVPHNVGG